jgi:A/G-specific adenine glycosylase
MRRDPSSCSPGCWQADAVGELRIWGPGRTRGFRARLLEWYDLHRRVLPWRSSPTPYRVWVSEIMLQQTQVKTVVPYFERFVARFPDVRALAGTPEEEVLSQWAGLGYYSRARNLRRAAQQIVERHGGSLPDSLEALLQLPGVGRYTAGAILSIAFNRRAPIVDGNVKRVIARLHRIEHVPPEAFCWEQAEAWTDAARPSDFNQAVMEFGALVCTPSSPSCPLCPVSALCAARRDGVQDRIPSPSRPKKQTRLELVMLWLERDGRVVLADNCVGFVPGSLGLPTVLPEAGEDAAAAAGALASKLAGRPTAVAALGEFRHAITHRRILIRLYAARFEECRGGRTVPAESVSSHVTSSIFRKAAALALRKTAADA